MMWLLFVFSLPFAGYALKTQFMALSVSNVLLLTLVLTTILDYAGRVDKRFMINWFSALIIALMGCFILLDLFQFIVLGDRLRSLSVYVSYLGIIVLALYHCESYDSVCKTLTALALGVLFLSVLTILNHYRVIHLPVRIVPPRSFFGYHFFKIRTLGAPITYGTFGIFSTSVLVVYCASFMKKIPCSFPRLFSFLCITSIVSGIILSQSRSTWLATTVSLSSFLFLFFNHYSKKVLKVAFFGVLAFVAYMVLTTDLVMQIFDGVAQMNISSVRSRFGQASFGVGMFMEKPFFGIGDGTFEEIYGNVIHNNFIGVLVASGTVPFLFYIMPILLVVGGIYIRLKRSRSTTPQIIYLCLLCGLLGGVTEMLFYRAVSNKAFWILMALSIAMFNIEGLKKGTSSSTQQE